MIRHWRYLKYVVRHKWFVFVACCQFGVPWLGLIHDWSKLLPSEWFPYVESFYGEKRISYTTVFAGERENLMNHGYKFKEDVQRDFDYAWLYHQRRNKHHWQYWQLVQDEDKTKVLEMPDRYGKEMLADWIGAGRAQGKPDILAWYTKNRDKMVLAPRTREWIEIMLDYKKATT